MTKAQRFKRQTFVSLDLSSSLMPSIDPNELVRHLDNALIGWLKQVVVDEAPQAMYS